MFLPYLYPTFDQKLPQSQLFGIITKDKQGERNPENTYFTAFRGFFVYTELESVTLRTSSIEKRRVKWGIMQAYPNIP